MVIKPVKNTILAYVIIISLFIVIYSFGRSLFPFDTWIVVQYCTFGFFIFNQCLLQEFQRFLRSLTLKLQLNIWAL